MKKLNKEKLFAFLNGELEKLVNGIAFPVEVKSDPPSLSNLDDYYTQAVRKLSQKETDALFNEYKIKSETQATFATSGLNKTEKISEEFEDFVKTLRVRYTTGYKFRVGLIQIPKPFLEFEDVSYIERDTDSGDILHEWVFPIDVNANNFNATESLTNEEITIAEVEYDFHEKHLVENEE